MRLYNRAIILFIVLLLSNQLNGKDLIKSAYYDLSIYNYFGAKEKFEKALKKSKVAASFGLSEIYKNDKNPFHSLDSARVYALMSDNSWPSTSEKERVKIAVYKIDSLSIKKQLEEIASLALSYSMEENTIDAFNHFIDNYTYSPLTKEAILRRNELLFAEAKQKNTSRSYREFMNFYPNALQYDQAKEQYELRVFEESNSFKNINDIERYIKEYPNSPYLLQAQDNLYKLCTKSGKIADYRSFIKKYPLNPNVDASWEQIYKIETAQVSPEVLSDFLMVYPDYPMIERVKEELVNLLKVLVPARLNEKWGFIDMEGNWIIRPIFDSCEPFSEGMALISRNDQFGFINTRGDEIVLAAYEDAESFKNGIAIVFDGEKYGAVNRFGDKVIDSKYDDIGEFNDGIAYASKKNKYGYIDRNGFVIIPFMYDQAFSFENGVAIAKQNKRFGAVDFNNKWLLPFEFDWIEPHFENSIIKVRKDNKFGIISLSMDTILSFEYDQIGRMDQQLILVVKDDKVGYINPKGEIVVPLKYETDPFILNWGEFDLGLARIKIKGKMGIIDSTGKRVVPAIFQEIGEFDGVLYPVKKNGKWGYADDKIKLQINYRYQKAYPFDAKYARVMKNNAWGLIDSLGKVALPIEYKRIMPSGGVYILENDSAFGMMDYEMNVILNTEFDQIIYRDLGYFEIQLNGKMAYLDIDRRKVFWKELGFKVSEGD